MQFAYVDNHSNWSHNNKEPRQKDKEETFLNFTTISLTNTHPATRNWTDAPNTRLKIQAINLEANLQKIVVKSLATKTTINNSSAVYVRMTRTQRYDQNYNEIKSIYGYK